MELTFTQAAKGVNKELTVAIDAACQRCDGKGHEPGSKVERCPVCSGSGMVRTPPPPHPPSPGAALLNTRVLIPAGDGEHGSVRDALHVPPVRR